MILVRNYRPISVVSVAAKVLEKLIATQLQTHLETHNLLHPHQGANRHGRSSDDILLYAVDSITQELDEKHIVCCAFLDLCKAFDSLDHVILLQRLAALGVNHTSLKWFQNYLSDRYQRVKNAGIYSDWGTVTGGIPQGSALGPLLFLVYVNDMGVGILTSPELISILPTLQDSLLLLDKKVSVIKVPLGGMLYHLTFIKFLRILHLCEVSRTICY